MSSHAMLQASKCSLHFTNESVQYICASDKTMGRAVQHPQQNILIPPTKWMLDQQILFKMLILSY